MDEQERGRGTSAQVHMLAASRLAGVHLTMHGCMGDGGWKIIQPRQKEVTLSYEPGKVGQGGYLGWLGGMYPSD